MSRSFYSPIIRFLPFLLFAVITCAVDSAASRACAQDAPARVQSEVWPQPAPLLVGSANDWLNTNGKPLKIEKGKVYLIDFWEYTCVNCIRTLPYLKKWNQRYAKDGLVIIGIHTPEFKFAKDRANVARAVKKFGIDWPVLIDSDYANWTAFANSFWPRKYFIDGKSIIVADHAGEGGYEESETRIQQLLKEIHPNLTFPKAMEPVRATDKPGVMVYPTTRELYAGRRGNESGQHGNISNFAVGKSATYNNPGSALEDGLIYLQGVWKTEEESLRHGRTTASPTDRVLLRYHALECNAVIKPEGGSGKPFHVYVTQDGKPVTKADKGDDIQYDTLGKSYFVVDAPRMYSLTRNAKFGSYLITMATGSPNFGLYSFTFTSSEMP